MTDIAIRVENLSKLYHIGAAQKRHDTLRDAIVDAFKRVNVRTLERADDTLLWALKDVSFEVKRGEVIGIIGRNGAGKSTLLKILSRITEPTSGRAEIHGRVGSLLEVGTGFHPELTGRENIYLNGAILGMHRHEIERKFDEIVAFAEIEKFLDTPVKRYSSGMYVRLAFAVAAHLEPEILLVDEVLAVGDAQFQKKCLGKMGDVAKEGRTVLFVSHNMTAIRHLCARGVVLGRGEVLFTGPASAAVDMYLARMRPAAADLSEGLLFRNPNPDPKLAFEMQQVEVLDRAGKRMASLHTGDYARFRLRWRATEDVETAGVELGIHTTDGVPLIQYSTRPVSNHDVSIRVGSDYIDCELESFPLAAGEYSLSVAITRPMVEWLYRHDSFGLLPVGETDIFKTGVPVTTARAYVAVSHRWVSHRGPVCR